ncbi:MAG: hypothetical protein M1142_01000 [Patescibacteria group bacterium]|nr:hypothetical protein [Patescibacteria group bacterium]
MTEAPVILKDGEWTTPFTGVKTIMPTDPDTELEGDCCELASVPAIYKKMPVVVRMLSYSGIINGNTRVAPEDVDTPMGEVHLDIGASNGILKVIQVPAQVAIDFFPCSLSEYRSLRKKRVEVDYNGSVYSLADLDANSPQRRREQEIEHDIKTEGNGLVMHIQHVNGAGKEREVAIPCNLENIPATLEVFSRIRVRIVNQELAHFQSSLPVEVASVS